MRKPLDTKDLMEVKFSMVDDADDKGVFTGLASVFNVIDSYGDIVLPGAFKKTLKESNPVPMLWNHSVDQPIGVVHLTETEKGLTADGRLNLDVVKAQEIRSLMRQGAVKGLSIGYQTVKEGRDKELNARTLKEVKLWEVSPVVFQACPGATVTAVKADEADIETEIEPCDDTVDMKTSEPATATPDDKPDMVHLLDALKFKREEPS